MRFQWNNCFLCLNDLGQGQNDHGTANDERGRKAKASLTVLFKYLLDTSSGVYGGVLKDLMDSLEGDGRIKLCGKCWLVTEMVMKWHLELEAAQMRIINGVKRVKEIVLQNSKLYGSNSGAKIGLEVFEDWLRQEEVRGLEGVNKERRILDCLYAFQTAVYEKDKDAVLVPRVFLDKFVNCRKTATAEVVVKSEPVENGMDYLDFGETSLDDFLQDSYSGFEDPLLETNNVVKEPKKRKRGKEDKDKVKLVGNKQKKEKVAKPKSRSKVKTALSEEELKKIEENLQRELEQEDVVKSEQTETEILDQNRKRNAAVVASQRIHINFDENEPKKPKSCKPKLPRIPKEKPAKSEETEPKQRKRRKKPSINLKLKKNKEPKKRGRHVRPLPPSFAVKSEIKGVRKTGRHMTTYGCSQCNYTTISPYRFEGHLRDHETPEKNFTCDRCADNRTFSGRQLFDFHTAHHDGYNRMRCDVCTRVLPALELTDHMRTHVDNPFPCPFCTYCCSNRDKYLSHLKEHKNCGRCDLCGLIFRSRHKLLGHYFEIHKVINKVKCDFEGCNKSFLDPENLRLHKKVHLQSHVCNICEKSFIDEGRLKVHQRIHTGEKHYKCEQCEEAFPTNVNLQRHRIRDHGAEKFKCTKCPSEYSCKQSLLVHNMIVHDGTGIPCGYPGCDKSFGTKTLWRRHQTVHSEERNFICQECGQQLKSRQQLNKHMLIHIGDKKFKCPYCEKAFIMEKYLVTHVRIHTGEKPFVCDLCGKAFNQYAALYMHKRKHLGDAAPPVNPGNGRPRANSSRAVRPNYYNNEFPTDLHSLDSNSSADVAQGSICTQIPTQDLRSCAVGIVSRG